MKIFLSLAAAVTLLGATTIDRIPNGSDSQPAIEQIVDAGIFNAVYPISYASHDVQQREITDRLEKIVALLGSRDVSHLPAALREARERNLERLLEYRLRGEFPVNYDYPGVQLPCFIDSAGAICAVGYLVEKSAGRDVAEAINREYKYATVGQMRSARLDAWIARSGFSRAEIATIQEPAMFGEPVYLPDEKGNMVQRTINGMDVPRRTVGDSIPSIEPVATPPVPVRSNDAQVETSPGIGDARSIR